MKKTCTKCGVEKPYSEFSPHRSGRGGVRSICKPCSVMQTMECRKKPSGIASFKKANRKYRDTPKGAAMRCESQRRSVLANPARYLWSRAKRRAAVKGVPFTIERSDIVIPERCPILGVKLTIATRVFRQSGFGGDSDSMSLDRLIPHLGYVPGNIAVISWEANSIKGRASPEHLMAVAKWYTAEAERVRATMLTAEVTAPADPESHDVPDDEK